MLRLAAPRSLVLLLLFALAGCGASERATQAPEAAPASAPAESQAPAGAPAEDQAAQEEQPATLEEAEAALRRAQAELDSALGPVAFATPPPAPAAEGAPKSSRPRAAAPQDEAETSAGAEPSAQKKGDGRSCELACRAFDSLSRAAQAVCRLDGDGGERCGRARKVLSDAESRVASCACTKP